MAKELANSQDLVEIEEIKNSAVILKNGGLRQILMVGGINFSLKSGGEQDALTAAYQNFLNSVDFPLQIIIHSRKININKYLEFLEKRAGEETSELLKNQIGEYREFVRGLIQENPIMAKTFLVIIPWVPLALPQKETVKKYIPFLKKEKADIKKESANKEADFQHDLMQLKQRVSQVSQGLEAMDLEVKVLDDEELIELFYNFYNPETIEKEGINLPK